MCYLRETESKKEEYSDKEAESLHQASRRVIWGMRQPCLECEAYAHSAAESGLVGRPADGGAATGVELPPSAAASAASASS